MLTPVDDGLMAAACFEIADTEPVMRWAPGIDGCIYVRRGRPRRVT